MGLLKKVGKIPQEAEAMIEKRGYSQLTSALPEYSAEDAIQPPDLTAGFSNLDFDKVSNTGLPGVNDCIAHLKLLECFYRLRQKIGSTDGLYGINNDVILNASDIIGQEKLPELLSKLAEKRWAIYVARAADRFEQWVNVVLPGDTMLNRAKLELDGKKGNLCKPCVDKPPLQLNSNSMPPIDVLLVWHAYMLNPRAYLEDALRYGRMQLWHTNMPWGATMACINSETFEYEAGKGAVDLFTGITGLPWDNLASEEPKYVKCPNCTLDLPIPWTNCSQAQVDDFDGKFRREPSAAIDEMLSRGCGYADKNLLVNCFSCNTRINHDFLRANKFCKDLQRLVSRDIPMAGTLLGREGIPFKFEKQADSTSTSMVRFPNDILKAGLGQEILDQFQGKNPNLTCRSMETVRTRIEDAMNDKLYVRRIRGFAVRRFTQNERISIRKMMSRYWDNSSVFALDLVGAVIRQGTFIEKMHNIDWLHSPALPNTMNRLLLKYFRFQEILSLFRGQKMAVPTLDVDLAWHTHQLMPATYMSYTVTKCKSFIDHDDKVAETQLNDSFAWTSKTYQNLYGEPYSECTCWYCEAIRESHTSTASRIFGSSSMAADKLHDVPNDPCKSVHISAHSAMRPTDSTKKYTAISEAKAAELEKAYLKACARASRKGRPEPRRNDYYYSDAYGYPVYIPAYSPYVGCMPYVGSYYPASPGCMALGPGAPGNCCAGTCGGGVAAGGCGGSSSGGCAGGATGGCGSGGSGGGCGGGSGGGGGGCGGGGGGGGGCGGGGGGGGGCGGGSG
ncbi:glycine-rich domain-containing protein 2 [Acrodontium crateriforme]|uniref:Glycine-rich domain-containing protein 2 n=1 Tax=Acrodontium crateriforme TaxID=150365 RepID=A0AAQ3M3P6_9PEZI|nr:glycine-rich domain-containing protein 2 [Acrodontium crateriforme]